MKFEAEAVESKLGRRPHIDLTISEVSPGDLEDLIRAVPASGNKEPFTTNKTGDLHNFSTKFFSTDTALKFVDKVFPDAGNAAIFSKAVEQHRHNVAASPPNQAMVR